MKVRNDHDLIQEVLDGSMIHEGFKSFQVRMRQEPELLTLYRQYALLHHSLCEEFEGQRIVRTARRAPRKPGGNWRAVAGAGLATAAAIAIAALVLFKGGRKPAAQLAAKDAKVEFSDDAVWSVKGSHSAKGQQVRIDPGAIVQLQQGQARFDFGGGALAVVDGNTEIEYVTGEKLRLGHGRGRFRVETPGRKLEVATPAMTAVDLGTEFGMLSQPGKPDEVHVFDGRVQVKLPADNDQGPVLGAGSAARVVDRKLLERIPVSMQRFPHAAPRFTHILEDRFDKPGPAGGTINGRNPIQGLGVWRVAGGEPKLFDSHLEGTGFTAFCKLPEHCLSDRQPVLLATLETTEPENGRFHTDGWAGMSFYRNGEELLFFGDGFGEEKTWSIDVKQGQPIVFPKSEVAGRRTVTLCYNRLTGAASLHEGTLPLGPAFVSATLPAGLDFDEIRIGASAGATLALRGLEVRTGESGEE